MFFLLPALRERPGGRRNRQHLNGRGAHTHGAADHYGAAKAALDAYGKALASELAPAGIRVTTIIPGNVLAPAAAPRQPIPRGPTPRASRTS